MVGYQTREEHQAPKEKTDFPIFSQTPTCTL